MALLQEFSGLGPLLRPTSAPDAPLTSRTSLIRYRRRGLEIGEVYFEDALPEPLPRVDLLRFLAVHEPRSERPWKRRNTLSVDMTLPEDELMRQMGKNNRYKVRRAMSRDSLEVQTLESPTPEAVVEFADYYDEFAGSKSLRPVFRPRLYAMAKSGMLVLSRASSDGEPLVWHAYAAGSRQALLMYSASLFRRYEDSSVRNMVGRANRFLHWHDMLWCRNAGYAFYDLGGINLAGEDEETRRVTDFKLGFGGGPRPSYTCTTALTAKGRLAKLALGLARVDL